MCIRDRGYEVIIGSRDSKDAPGACQAIPQPLWKRFLGNVGNLLIQILAVPGIWDTQCGFKCFSEKAAKDIFSKAKINGWGFDIEVLALARKLGYKDKKGFVVVRVRVKRGGHKRPRPKKGRKSKNLTIRKTLKMNYRWIAEYRAQKKYKNLEVLNSYLIAKDGQHYFYEIILVDPTKPEIKADKTINWICSNKNRKRAFRGLTSAAKKARGLRS